MAQDKTQYQFEGETLGKGQLVLKVINYYLQLSHITFIELQAAYSTVVSGRNGLILSKADYGKAVSRSPDIGQSYFTKSPLRDNEGTVFYVSSQWSLGNIDRFIECSRTLGCTINIIADQSSDLIQYFNYYKTYRLGDWQKTYQERCDFISKIDVETFDFADEEFLKSFWALPHNGIASVQPGHLSLEEFEALKSELSNISQIIVTKPSMQTHTDMLNWALRCKNEGKFNTIKYGVINRFFCACCPEQVTTILNFDQLKRFVSAWNRLKLGATVEITDNWFDLNARLLNAIKMRGLEQEDIYLVNTFVYRLKEFLTGENDAAFGEDFKPYHLLTLAEVPPPILPVTTPLNQVLYGPPGTGKTYRTIELAVSIIDPTCAEKLKNANLSTKQTRAKFKARFDQLLKNNQVAFTTFHQSFSYEDFVEGLKAESDGGQISYCIEDGIFKKICIRAGTAKYSKGLEAAITQVKEKCSEEPLQLLTATGKVFSVTYRGHKTFRCLPEASVGQRDLPANIDHVRRVCLGDIPDNLYCGSYVRAIAKHVVDSYGIDTTELETTDSDKKIVQKTPHVLIIDEINRGNISKIFGELITLLEPSKRKGEAEALSVTLPYSKETFSVPSSLFVIGTMNTADSSLTKIDFALRRRFEFVEVMPAPELLPVQEVAGVDVKQLLTTINQRIELLYDRDHTIGHSYFMGLSENSGINDLAVIFEKQIIPLLKEYFYEDWALIHRVLGDHLKGQNQPQFIVKRYSGTEISHLMGADWQNDNSIQPIWHLNRDALTDPDAYRGIYTPGKNSPAKKLIAVEDA